MSQETLTYKENFTKLVNARNTLADMAEPDVDVLIPVVEEANKAYLSCMERIAQVEAALSAQAQSRTNS
ncbi:exodeoxyribonuclease VII small subunit [Pseudomonas luteola]